MKYIFVNPVSYNINFAPVIGIPELLGVLEREHIENEFIDLNLNYLNSVLNKNSLFEYIQFCDSAVVNKTSSKFPSFKEKYIKIRKSFYQISKRVEFSTYILKHKLFFYSPILVSYADRILSYAVDNLGIIYNSVLEDIIPDAESYRSLTENPEFNLEIDKLVDFFESEFNPLKEYYENEVDKILKKKPDCIGITISVSTQIISGLYLGYLLKKRTNVHINIGGSFFNDYHKLITNLKDCFGLFFDTISINENTLTILKLASYLNNEIEINKVDNLIYLKSCTVEKNKIIEKNNYSAIPFQAFNGYDMNKYLSPELVLPLRASTSCYWGKCIFCFCSSSCSYQIRPVENVIDEILYLSKKYNTKFFYFWDNSLPPEYLERLADKILENRIKIYYSIYARFESGFTKQLLKKLKKSGCVKILWGLDSASPSVLDYVKKGIDINKVPQILKNAYLCGISNTVHLILGHPSEKIEDLEADFLFISKNKKYIDLLNIGFQLYYFEGAVITEEREKYKKLITIDEKERIEYRNKIFSIAKWTQHSIYSVGTYNVLYLKKYGPYLLRIYHLFHLFIRENEKLCTLYIKFYLKLYEIVKNYK